MILLIDNYDSFSYNLVQMAGGINPDIQVIRNDAMTVEEVEKLSPSHICDRRRSGSGNDREASCGDAGSRSRSD